MGLCTFMEKLLVPIKCDDIKSKDGLTLNPSDIDCSGIPFDLIQYLTN